MADVRCADQQPLGRVGIVAVDRPLHLALDLGCRLGQGFFFGSPLSRLGLSGYLAAVTLPTRAAPHTA